MFSRVYKLIWFTQKIEYSYNNSKEIVLHNISKLVSKSISENIFGEAIIGSVNPDKIVMYRKRSLFSYGNMIKSVFNGKLINKNGKTLLIGQFSYDLFYKICFTIFYSIFLIMLLSISIIFLLHFIDGKLDLWKFLIIIIFIFSFTFFINYFVNFLIRTYKNNYSNYDIDFMASCLKKCDHND